MDKKTPLHNALYLFAISSIVVMAAFAMFKDRNAYPVIVYTSLEQSSQSGRQELPSPNPSSLSKPVPEDNEEVFYVQFPLDINQAGQSELMAIPGIGETLAQRILQYRDVLGGYSNLEQLMEIKGIGKATYSKIEPYLIIN